MRRSSPSPIVFVLLAVAPLACAATDSIDDPTVESGHEAVTACAHGATVPGIDVSHYQSTIDWHKVRADGKRFGLAKATQGTWFVDPYFAHNWSGMKAEGVVRGAYGWIESGNGADQADYYLAHVKFEHGDLPPIVDVEDTGIKAEMVGDWVDRIKEKTGRTAIIYTSIGAWNHKSHTDGFSENPLYVAYWTSGACPMLPHPWKTWKFWQPGGGHVDGISVHTDEDVFNGSFADLTAFAGGSTTTEDGVGAGAHTVAVTPNLLGEVEVFAVSGDGRLHHRWHQPSGGWSAWHAFSSAGGGFVEGPAAANDLDGRMEVAIVGHDGGLWLMFQNADASWADPYRLGEAGGGFVGQPRMVRDGDGRLQIFVRGKDDAIWQMGQKHAGGSWSALRSLGKPGHGTAIDPGVAVDGDGLVHVFACASGGDVHEARPKADGTWGGFASLDKPEGGCAHAPSIHLAEDGRLELYVDTNHGELARTRQESVGGAWKPFSLNGSPEGIEVWKPGVLTNLTGNTEVFVRGDDGGAWHTWRLADGSGWAPFHRFAGDAHFVGTPITLTRSDGTMEVFYRSTDGAVWAIHQRTDGSWRDAENLDAP